MNRASEIIVSGIGIVTPLGNGREKTWVNLLEGRSGIALGPDGLEARVSDFSLNGARSRMGDFALLAAQEALEHAGLSSDTLKNKTVGCAIGQSKPIVAPSLDASLLLSSFTGWSAEGVVRRAFHLEGPSSNPVAACATGVAALQMGFHWLQDKDCDIVLVGAAEASLNPFFRAAFQQMGVLADGNSATAGPFDAARCGFVMGEGAALFVLERMDSCLARGGTPLAILSAVSMRHNPNDLIRFEPSGASIEKLVTNVAKNILPGYVNAHGTGTRLNDVVEARGLQLAFGDRVMDVPVSSTKGATGHLLGAAGAVEAAFCVLALRDQVIPATKGLNDPDSECRLQHVMKKPQSKKLETALSLSYGFGGQLGGVLFSRYEQTLS